MMTGQPATHAHRRGPHFLTAKAPGKINLILRVLGRRSDGYHEVRSLVVAVDLCDAVHVGPRAAGEIALSVEPPIVPADRRNLVWQAAERLAAHAGIAAGAEIRLEKAIPPGSGLGGGSSDAAAALRLLCRVWDVPLSGSDLAGLGAALGSDVPFFFHLPAAVIEGRGERVRPVPFAWPGWVVLFLADRPCHTAEVYARWRPEDSTPGSEEVAGLDGLSARELDEALVNDLRAGAFRAYGWLRDLAEALSPHVAGRLHLAGSGSTLFALFDEAEHARHVAEKAADRLAVRTCVTRLLQSDPVGDDGRGEPRGEDLTRSDPCRSQRFESSWPTAMPSGSRDSARLPSTTRLSYAI